MQQGHCASTHKLLLAGWRARNCRKRRSVRSPDLSQHLACLIIFSVVYQNGRLMYALNRLLQGNNGYHEVDINFGQLQFVPSAFSVTALEALVRIGYSRSFLGLAV